MTANDTTRTTLVTSLEESTGKTAITLALARLASDRGETVGYMKPKGTRLESNVGKTLDSDPLLAREVLDLEDDVGDMEPVVYSPTFVREAIRGREDPGAIADRVREAYDALAADRDHVFVEGGGSLTTGGIVELTDPAVADLLDARVVLVAGYDGPYDLDDVLAAADRLGDRLEGVVFNGVEDANFDELDGDAAPFLERRSVPVAGIVPQKRALAGVTVAELAEELGAELVTDAGTDRLVERFAVGAMSPDTALKHLRRSKDVALITGGDRSDVQTAALEAASVRCLVLTGGGRPSRAVLGKAEERGVPVMLVSTDTLSTVERAEGVVRGGRTRNRETVDEMQGLLSEHADVEALLGPAGDGA